MEAIQENKVIDYVKNQLSVDLENFEKRYGYQGNKKLAQWLILQKIFPEEIEFTDRTGMYHIFYEIRDLPFMPTASTSDNKDNYKVGLQMIDALIPALSPYLLMGNDGRGGHYFAGFWGENNDVLVFDHDPYGFYKLPVSLVSLMKKHSVKKVFSLIEATIDNHADLLGFDKIKNSSKKLKYTVKQFQSNWTYLRKIVEGLTNEKPFNTYSTTDNSPFDGKNVVQNSIADENSDYHTFNNIRALYNADIVGKYYWLYFTGQIELLKKCLIDTEKILGSYYQSVRKSFIELLNENHTNLAMPFNTVEKIRHDKSDRLKTVRREIAEMKFENAEEEARFILDKFIELKHTELTISPMMIRSELFSILVVGLDYKLLQEYFSKFKFLEKLTFDRFIIEQIPSSIGSLVNLKELRFDSLRLTSLPDSISKLKKVEKLNLSGNCFEKIPDVVFQLPLLKELKLSHNKFKVFPNQTGNIENLNISNNSIVGFPEKGSDYTKLRTLTMDNNEIKSVSESIREFSQLRTLKLKANHIRFVSPEISKLKELIHLYVSKNELTDFPVEITELQKLKYLELTDNKIVNLNEEIIQDLSGRCNLAWRGFRG